MISRDSLQFTRGFDLKRHFGIKRHDRLSAPDDKVDAGTTTCCPKNDAGATAGADERQREFMAAILERRADQIPVATRSTIEKPPPIKTDFKEFSGEPEDWTTWSEIHRAQLSALGCADALTESAGDETKVNRDFFYRGSADPDRLRKTQQAWVSLVTSCKGVAFDIVNAEESASEVWAKLV